MSAQVIRALHKRAAELEAGVTTEPVRFLDGLSTVSLGPVIANVVRLMMADEFRRAAAACEAVDTPADSGVDSGNAITQGDTP